MKLSVIIPVYNGGTSLMAFVKSVRKGAFSDYEIILVDDGSTDLSSKICDFCADKDGKISVIHKKHKGLSSARNAALDAAKGEYITFVDSDDTVAAGTYATLMELLGRHPEYDMLEYPVYEYYGNERKQHLLTFKDKEYTDTKAYWFGTNAYLHTYACNKIYSRKVFSGVRYTEGISFEDVRIMPDILAQCKVIATTYEGLYYYIDNSKGITGTAGGKELADLLAAHIRLIGTELSPFKSAKYYVKVLNIQLDVYKLTGNVPILPPFSSLKYDTLTTKLLLSKLIGVKNLCLLNKYIYKKQNK